MQAPAAPTWRDTLIGVGVSITGIGAATALLAPFRDRLGLLNVGMLFLVIVVVIAARWGWGPGLFASIAANLSLNFFFVPPLHRFVVHDPANVLALLVFLFVAGLTSTLLARARAGEAVAQRREQETTVLYDLTRLIIGEVELSTTLTTICERVRETFTARSCAVLVPVDGRVQPAAWSGPRDAGLETADERWAAEQALTSGITVALGSRPGARRPRVIGVTGRPAPVVYVPLRVGGRAHGMLRVVGNLRARVFTADELRLLEAFADEAAPAVDRDNLLREAARVQALQQADQLKSALLSAVSHDFRTPLTSILTSASSLLQPDIEWDEATRRQLIVHIEEQALRLTRLVSNLLDLSRIEGGALRPDQDWYDIGELLAGAVDSLAPGIADHRIVLDVAPHTGEACFDHVEISQVIVNLVENAARFSPPGTEIRIAARRHDGEVEISVSDQGPGIPPQERERVFEKFYRLDGAPAGRGTGLGLAIVKGFVEANGGQIGVEDAPGGGARFVVRLPAPPPPVSRLAAAGEGA